MDDVEKLLENIRAFYAALEKLRAMEGPEMLLPGKVDAYQETLEDAYAAYGQHKEQVDELGRDLEYQQKRLDEGVKKYGERR